jgi:hypothetical protein
LRLRKSPYDFLNLYGRFCPYNPPYNPGHDTLSPNLHTEIFTQYGRDSMAVLVAQFFFEVSPLIFSTDYSPIHWLQSVLKNQAFLKMYFFFYTFLKIRRHVGEMMNWISMVPP